MFHSFEASLILYFFSSVPRCCSNFLLDHTLLALFPPLLRATLLFQHFLRLVHWPINDCTFESRQREKNGAKGHNSRAEFNFSSCHDDAGSAILQWIVEFLIDSSNVDIILMLPHCSLVSS